MVTSCITEQLDTAKEIVSEYEELNTGVNIEVPEYAETVVAQDVDFDSGGIDDGGQCVDVVEDIRESTIDTGVEAGMDKESPGDEHVVYELESLPRIYAEYTLLSLEEKVTRYNLERGADVFKAVQSYYQSIGHDFDFSEVFDESQLLEQGAKELAINEKAAAIAEIILERGYDYCDMSFESKAALMSFNIRDNNYNLALYSAVTKKLGVQMSMDERYEDYQRIYDEKMRQGNSHQNEEKSWYRGR